MTVTIAGVDGCRGGWACVLRKITPPFQERAFLVNTVQEILEHPEAPAMIAIDIPIGLPARVIGGGRTCDLLVRKAIGARGASVFAVPARVALAETDYRLACAAALAASDPPRAISKQMFHLFPKIREVDAVITPELQSSVAECHPEAAFWAMNGHVALTEPKKKRGRLHAPGMAQRRTLLLNQGFPAAFLDAAHFPRKAAGADDFFDACACAWSAARILNGEAIRFPPSPPLDAKGIRMEILA